MSTNSSSTKKLRRTTFKSGVASESPLEVPKVVIAEVPVKIEPPKTVKEEVITSVPEDPPELTELLEGNLATTYFSPLNPSVTIDDGGEEQGLAPVVSSLSSGGYVIAYFTQYLMVTIYDKFDNIVNKMNPIEASGASGFALSPLRYSGFLLAYVTPIVQSDNNDPCNIVPMKIKVLKVSNDGTVIKTLEPTEDLGTGLANPSVCTQLSGYVVSWCKTQNEPNDRLEWQSFTRGDKKSGPKGSIESRPNPKTFLNTDVNKEDYYITNLAGENYLRNMKIDSKLDVVIPPISLVSENAISFSSCVLINGYRVITWNNESSAAYFRLLRNDGKLIVENMITGSGCYRISCVSLLSGGFIVLYIKSLIESYMLLGTYYDVNGNFVDKFIVDKVDDSCDLSPKGVCSLLDTGFIVTWTSYKSVKYRRYGRTTDNLYFT